VEETCIFPIPENTSDRCNISERYKGLVSELLQVWYGRLTDQQNKIIKYTFHAIIECMSYTIGYGKIHHTPQNLSQTNQIYYSDFVI